MATVADFYSAHNADFYKCLKTNGISGIARYLTNSEGDARQLTPAEVQYAHDAGLEVHFVFEMSPTYAAYFSFAQGVYDALAAKARLDWLGAPQGIVVYFAVDAPAGTIPPAVLDEYFNGVASAAGSRFVPGIYGYMAHVEHARANYPVVGKHLWETYGTPQGSLDMWQNIQETICGVEVDLNDATIQGWGGAQGEKEMTPDQVDARIREFFASEEFVNAVRDGYGKKLEEVELTPIKDRLDAVEKIAPSTPSTDVPAHKHTFNGTTS